MLQYQIECNHERSNLTANSGLSPPDHSNPHLQSLSVKHLPYFCLARDGHMSYLLILHYIIGRTTGVILHDTFETGSSKQPPESFLCIAQIHIKREDHEVISGASRLVTLYFTRNLKTCSTQIREIIWIHRRKVNPLNVHFKLNRQS